MCADCRQWLNRARPDPVARGYGENHQVLRVRCFERDGWRCQSCQWTPAVVAAFEAEGQTPPVEVVLADLRRAKRLRHRHLHADHRIRIVDAPELAGDLNNLQTLCNVCHSAKTIKEISRA